MYDETVFNPMRRIKADVDAYAIAEEFILLQDQPCEIILEYDYLVSLKIDMNLINGAFYAPFIIQNTRFKIKR